MFYKLKIQDHVRVMPQYFGLGLKDAVMKAVKEKFAGYVDEQLGIVIDVADVSQIGEGVIISGDGASYYDATFDVITFKPEMQELIVGRVKDIADFGAFLSLGPLEGMIHISQTMDDFVSFAKEKVLTGKETKRALKVGDQCRARVIAISFKDPMNRKIGLTMRQQGLGKVEWIAEDIAKDEKPAAAAAVDEKKAAKEKK